VPAFWSPRLLELLHFPIELFPCNKLSCPLAFPQRFFTHRGRREEDGFLYKRGKVNCGESTVIPGNQQVSPRQEFSGKLRNCTECNQRWLSAGEVLPPRGIWHYLETLLVVKTGEQRTSWRVTRSHQKCA
jgi:hypothetical protein